MHFVQQPQDTTVNDLFLPPPSVQISDGASDSLTISSPTCDILPITVTADSTGLALFVGLLAGPTPSNACTLIVHNNTRPGVADVVSNAFQLVPAVAVSSWELINAIATGSDSPSFDVTASLDVTGANVILVAAGYFRGGGPAPGIIPFSNPFLNFSANLRQSINGRGSVDGPQRYNLSTFAFLNTNIIGTLNVNFGFLPDPTYPTLVVLAFRAINPSVILQADFYGNTSFISAGNTSQPFVPLPFTMPGSLNFSAFLTDGIAAVSAPAGYTVFEQNTGAANTSIVGAAGFRLVDNVPVNESPVWQITTSSTNIPLITANVGLLADLM
jgi:hypothetical protein